jgi:hypothetical protein
MKVTALFRVVSLCVGDRRLYTKRLLAVSSGWLVHASACVQPSVPHDWLVVVWIYPPTAQRFALLVTHMTV